MICFPDLLSAIIECARGIHNFERFVIVKGTLQIRRTNVRIIYSLSSVISISIPSQTKLKGKLPHLNKYSYQSWRPIVIRN